MLMENAQAPAIILVFQCCLQRETFRNLAMSSDGGKVNELGVMKLLDETLYIDI